MSPSFLPLYDFEVGFHLTFHPFFAKLFKSFRVGSGQLVGSGWWVLVNYFLNFQLHSEQASISVFRHCLVSEANAKEFVMITSRGDVPLIMSNVTSNTRLDRTKYIGSSRGESPNGWDKVEKNTVPNGFLVGVPDYKNLWPYDSCRKNDACISLGKIAKLAKFLPSIDIAIISVTTVVPIVLAHFGAVVVRKLLWEKMKKINAPRHPLSQQDKRVAKRPMSTLKKIVAS
ncbi:hypothetical protein V6N13_122468 [Hibiscus sabdariffa]